MARKLKPKKKKRNKRKKGTPTNIWAVETKVTKSLADYLNIDDLEFEAELLNKLPEILETLEEDLTELPHVDTIRAIWNTRGTNEYIDAFKECFGMECVLMGLDDMTEEQTRIFLEFCFDNLADIPPDIVSPVNSDYVDIWREDW